MTPNMQMKARVRYFTVLYGCTHSLPGYPDLYFIIKARNACDVSRINIFYVCGVKTTNRLNCVQIHQRPCMQALQTVALAVSESSMVVVQTTMYDALVSVICASPKITSLTCSFLPEWERSVNVCERHWASTKHWSLTHLASPFFISEKLFKLKYW